MLNIAKQYSKQGFCEGSFEKQTSVIELRDACIDFLEKSFGKRVLLSEYHHFVEGDERHREIHYELTQHLRNMNSHKQLVLDNLSIFSSLVGEDIDVQVEPYLRISRPNKSSDNIGLHRDTFYGNSPYEISCIVPLEDFVSGAAVNVWPGSQHLGEIEFRQRDHETVAKGSKQNQIGFLYAPKELIHVNRDELYAPLLKVGEYMMFSLGLIHGQEVNSSNITRWSFDFRYKSSFHKETDDLKKSYYESICQSPANLVGRHYLDAMEKSSVNE